MNKQQKDPVLFSIPETEFTQISDKIALLIQQDFDLTVDDSIDIARDALLTAVKWADTHPDQVKTDVSAIAFTEAHHKAAREKKHQDCITSLTFDIFEAEGSSSTHDQQTLQIELKHEIQRALGKLPGEQRSVFLLHLAGASTAQIAQVRGITKEEVQRLRTAGIRRMRNNKALAAYVIDQEGYD